MENQPISQYLQDSIIHLCITDTDFLKAVGRVLKPSHFTSEVSEAVFKVITKYFKKYGKAPKKSFHNELILYSKKLDADSKEALTRYVMHLKDIESPDSEYVLSQIDEFVESQNLVNATYKFAELLESGDINKAKQFMTTALKQKKTSNQNIGVDYLNDFTTVTERGNAPERLFKTGIQAIDEKILITRSDLVTIAGPYKGTKTWFCHHLVKQALLEGLVCVHVSHENSLNKTILRYDMMFGALIDEKVPKKVQLRWMEGNKIKRKMEKRGTVYDKELVIKARKKIYKLGGRLIVKKYPMGTCSPVDLEAYLDYLISYHNIKPDVVVTDYADIMAPIDTSKQTRDTINETYIYLKRIADDKELVMITPSQINDEGTLSLIGTGKIQGRNLAEDKRKFANIDRGFFVGTTPDFEEYNEAVVGCFANRDGTQNVNCVIGQNLTIGQFYVYEYPFMQ